MQKKMAKKFFFLTESGANRIFFLNFFRFTCNLSSSIKASSLMSTSSTSSSSSDVSKSAVESVKSILRRRRFILSKLFVYFLPTAANRDSASANSRTSESLSETNFEAAFRSNEATSLNNGSGFKCFGLGGGIGLGGRCCCTNGGHCRTS